MISPQQIRLVIDLAGNIATAIRNSQPQGIPGGWDVDAYTNTIRDLCGEFPITRDQRIHPECEC